MTQPRIAVIDYGMGNLCSVDKALEHLGLRPVVTHHAAEIEAADGVVLPGVGAFGDAMRELEARGLTDVARERASEAQAGGRPFLGICLGMQVLVNEGEEDPDVPGLGVIPGICPRLSGVDGLKVPHMGWNRLDLRQKDNPLFAGLPEETYAYFVHSYHVQPEDPAVVAATCHYGRDVVAVLREGNLFATQFHPEKSQRAGLAMLANFGRVAAAARQGSLLS